MVKVELRVWGHRCERCKHEWIPRIKKDKEPIICPKCKSPYWNVPKKNKAKATK